MPTPDLRCRGLVVAPGGTSVLEDVDLEVPAGRMAVLLGPSGVGKTTLLRAVSGLQPIEAGEIRLGHRDLRTVPAHRRGIAMVFQEPRLFPNLSVTENVAFPLRAQGAGRAQRRHRARELLDEVGIAQLADRRPRGLSGGEAQRVALARALCAEPDLLLLDEPLSAVDPERREGLRGLVRAVQRERSLTTVYVTHDRAEAAELGDELALLLAGRVVQQAPPRTLFEQPHTVQAARFLGANVLRGAVTAGRLHLDVGNVEVAAPDGQAAFAIRPEHVRLCPDAPLPGEVVASDYTGGHSRVVLAVGGQQLSALLPPDQAPTTGATVRVDLPKAHLWRIPEQIDPGPGREGHPATGRTAT
ncbi:MAG: ABC transporter ATP-binding protein [Actinomycetota bacterium]|nr:ABC transporter ATP-binding protein [Actinomycetota bacterium]